MKQKKSSIVVCNTIYYIMYNFGQSFTHPDVTMLQGIGGGVILLQSILIFNNNNMTCAISEIYYRSWLT